MKLETLKQEKEGVDGKLAGLLTASKDLDNLIESQRADKNKEGLGYSVVPHPPTQIYYSPKKDLSWTGLPEFADDTVTDYSRPSPTMESTSGDDQNKNPFVTKTEASPSTISPKPFIKFVKAVDKAAERSTTNKVETVKKPSVRYAELYRKPSKKPTKKAYYNYSGIDHLSYDCGLGVKKRRTCLKNNYTHVSMPPRSVTHRPYRPPMRPNMNSAWPNKPAHSYGRRPFQKTTQDLVVVLILRVQRLERELKARTPIQKVDRGRSRPVMDWVPKKVKENQEKDKIGSKPNKNGKRGKAGKSLKQLQWVEEEKLNKTQKRMAKNANTVKSYSILKRKKKRKGSKVQIQESTTIGATTDNCLKLYG
nr:hypothetical protein [Tanacetum cinerariifolium]